MNQGFIDTVRELRGGETLQDLADELQGLVCAVRQAGRPGKLVFTLTVKPASKGNVDTLLLEDAIVIKAPVLDRACTIMFATANNILSRQDPRQPELSGLREVVPMSPRKEQAQ